jgi:uncharacterized protein YkwD
VLRKAWIWGILLAVVCSLAVSAPAGARRHTGRAPAAAGAFESQVLAAINDVRRRNRLAPLRVSTQLSAAAESHSNAMARRGFFAHESADGTAFWRRIQRFYPNGRHRYWSVGETLAWASPGMSSADALEMWMHSPPHREILLTGRWREVGIASIHVEAGPGVYGGQPATILTADFGVRR